MRTMLSRQFVLLSVVLLLTTSSALTAGLAKPATPTYTIQGTPGNRTIYYWEYASDGSGHSVLSDPLKVTNAPATLDGANYVRITPSTVTGATEYGILTSRLAAPTITGVTKNATGATTYYYWVQARNGRTVLSPVWGPYTVTGCSSPPNNTVSWSSVADADAYFLYRTTTNTLPIGFRSCGIATGYSDTSCSDTVVTPTVETVLAYGNPEDCPLALGRFLVGTSAGGTISDTGVALIDITTIFSKGFYNINTTDPAYLAVNQTVNDIERSAGVGNSIFNHDSTTTQPNQNHTNWDGITSIGITQRNKSGGLSRRPQWFNPYTYDYSKNNNTVLNVYQENYTPNQHELIFGTQYNYGAGDNVGLLLCLVQQGLNRDGGDEGTEIFSCPVIRELNQRSGNLSVASPQGSRFIFPSGTFSYLYGAGGRIVVNLTQAYSTGTLSSVSGTTFNGTGTNWTADMEGRWISLDNDNTVTDTDTFRQWYLIKDVVSSTQLIIYGYTYWSWCVYRGNGPGSNPPAGNYKISPAVEISDGDSWALWKDQYGTSRWGLKVSPVTTTWNLNDQVQVIAGPQTTLGFGELSICGKFLPQDCIKGLHLNLDANRHSNDSAVNILGTPTSKWAGGVQVINAISGVKVVNCDRGIETENMADLLLVIDWTSGTTHYNTLFNDQGKGFGFKDWATGIRFASFYKDGYGGLEANGVPLKATDATRATTYVQADSAGVTVSSGVLTGNSKMRGTTQVTASAGQTDFSVSYPSAYTTAPYVTYAIKITDGGGAIQPAILSSLSAMSTTGFTVKFNSAVTTGHKVDITWMVMQ
ncbi:MAG: hypothetical protein ACYC7E_15700 [Armatimonadota bacterium]